MINGHRTYIIAAVVFLVAVGHVVLKIANDEPITVEDVYAILGSLGLGAARAGIKKAENSKK